MKEYFRFLPPVGFLPVTLDSLRLVGLPPSSAIEAEAQQVLLATSNPFTLELRTLLQARQVAEGSAGPSASLVNRGVDGFDYARFFDSKQYFWIRSEKKPEVDGKEVEGDLVLTVNESDGHSIISAL